MRVLIAFIVLNVIIAEIGCAGEDMHTADVGEPTNQQIVKAILENDIVLFEKHLSIVKLQRKHKIDILMGMANSPDMPMNARGMAMYLLGELHATEAVDLLVANIDVSIQADVPVGRRPLLPSLPAIAALCKIGAPAVVPIWESSKKITDDESMYRRINVIRIIYGWDTFDIYSNAMIKKIEDKEQSDRMQAAVTRIQNNRPIPESDIALYQKEAESMTPPKEGVEKLKGAVQPSAEAEADGQTEADAKP